jgi:hypothetical protein
MKTKLILSFVLAANLLFSQNNKEFDNLPSGIYFKDGNQITALDPTIVNFSKRGNFLLHAYGLKIKSIGELTGKEANYMIKSRDLFYFKFKPEEKELNSSNSNATDKVGEENYMNILLSGTNSKAISPNEFKLIKFKLKNGKRTYYAGKYNDAMGYTINYSLSPKEVVDFKYKKIGENLFEIYFPNGLVEGEYSFVYLSNTQSNLPLKSSVTKVFDFSVK